MRKRKDFKRTGYIQSVEDNKLKNKYYILFFLMLVLAFSSINVTIKNSMVKNKESYSVFKSIDSNKKIQDLSQENTISPIENGEIIKEYSQKNDIYFETLDMYLKHNGIDIACNDGEKVKCIYDGMVEKIYDDSSYGRTIVIVHDNNYKSIYANLDNKEQVITNEYVVKGKVIGYVGKSSIAELNEKSHIHISIMKDTNFIDPATVIAF